ncbi:sugar ABC transporter substrate-binding protein [Niallia taxi]|uniref:sugar ABC transporter substrate-binding protein n=1 Tax=Niallia taxi TaxID=2499688 RepID=UPI00203FFCF1|nr:sugar ABC transporter substrate-binding protein [Niallia taxi]MCM3217495.1 sugar ABC transporter substrate-binding protein [Niallia taxi]MED4055634.1 sugar ABC transporter substrate-binding protein [Niallia taxi]MED4121296.1 sugar ABC transporter substrate-binding protein [Niallia taxi]
MKKKWFIFGMTALLALGLLAGCSQKSSSSDSNVLTVWGMGDEVKQLPKMAEEFTKETGIEVNIQSIPWASAHDKLLTAVASKKGPDVLQMGTTWMPEFQAAGALADMGDYIDKYPNLKPDNFFEGSVETTQFDSKYYGIPWAAETRVLFYRTDILEAVGYKEAPKTWEELKDAAKKLSERGENMYGLNVDAKEQTLGFMFARQNGSALVSEGKPLFNEKAFTEAVSYLNDFIEKGYAPKQDLGMDVSQTFSGDAIVPMFISGPWMVKAVNDTVQGIEGKWATAVLPSGSDNNLSSLGGSNLTIFEHSKKKDEAAQFIDFMMKKENQLKWLELTNAMPTVKSAWEDDSLANDPLYKVFGQQMESSRSMPLLPEFEEIAQNYLKHFEQIYLGGKKVEQEMDAFTRETEELLNK